MTGGLSNSFGIQKSIRSARRLLAPPPDLKPSDWAESNIKIPVGNAVPGLIRFDNAPYQREPLDMTADPSCQRVTLMWGAQVGKTTLALCGQAYRISQNPSSQMMMQPSQGDLHTWLETKFNPLVDQNETLQKLIAKPRGRDGVNNQRMKSYPGGFLMFSWSGSPKTMRGRSAPFIVCDETDGYDRTSEGHPVGLLWQRAATFGDQRMLMEISTPTFKGVSWIESSFEQGDQRRFHVACPHCGEHQHLKWANVTWHKDDDGNHLPETARYACESCGTGWNDGERIAAIRNAERLGAGWKPTKPFRGHASYHLNEMYSCFRKLADIVQSFLDKRSANDLQTFVNVSLAETWEENEGEQIESSDLMSRAEEYRAEVPAGGVVITAGIDMQPDRLEVEAVAWGLGQESWSIDYKVLWGDPMNQEVWDDLDDYLDQDFQHQSGARLNIMGACLDTGGTGGYTQAAYEYVRTKKGRKVFAIKGVGGWGRPIVSAPKKSKAGGARLKPVTLFSVGVDEAKVVVSKRFGITMPGPGYCHFPKDRDTEWFQQITAEKLVPKYVRGFPVREWHNTRDRNEGLDCRVYAYAALKIMNPNIKKLSDKLNPVEEPQEQSPSNPDLIISNRAEKPPVEEETQKRKTRRRKRKPRRQKSWVKNW